MGRLIRNWTPDRVEDATVAPHRYLWSGAIGADGKPLADIAMAEDWRAAKACIPYVEGDVIYVDRDSKAVKARVVAVLMERDRFGDRRGLYHVQVETAAGTWSKLWEKAWPGFVQRGYKRAGLAPDVLE